MHVYPVILELLAHLSARVLVRAELCAGWPHGQLIPLKHLTAVPKKPSAVRQKYST